MYLSSTPPPARFCTIVSPMIECAQRCRFQFGVGGGGHRNCGPGPHAALCLVNLRPFVLLYCVLCKAWPIRFDSSVRVFRVCLLCCSVFLFVRVYWSFLVFFLPSAYLYYHFNPSICFIMSAYPNHICRIRVHACISFRVSFHAKLHMYMY